MTQRLQVARREARWKHGLEPGGEGSEVKLGRQPQPEACSLWRPSQKLRPSSLSPLPVAVSFFPEFPNSQATPPPPQRNARRERDREKNRDREMKKREPEGEDGTQTRERGRDLEDNGGMGERKQGQRDSLRQTDY